MDAKQRAANIMKPYEEGKESHNEAKPFKKKRKATDQSYTKKKSAMVAGPRQLKRKMVAGPKQMKRKGGIKTSGSFEGKSNALGQGGRAAQLRAQGVPGGVIGNLARRAQAAPGQKNYHKKKK